MSTPTEDSLEPGPDGKLISTEERMQIIQQQQQPETTPEKAAPVEGMTSHPTHHKHHIHLILLPQQSGTRCCSISLLFSPSFLCCTIDKIFTYCQQIFFRSKLSKIFNVFQQKYLLIMGMVMS